FDLKQLDRFLQRVEQFRIPIIGGIWPLVSLRNAEFLANEVPGVSVPREVLDRMRCASEKGKETALADGVKIATERLAPAQGRAILRADANLPALRQRPELVADPLSPGREGRRARHLAGVDESRHREVPRGKPHGDLLQMSPDDLHLHGIGLRTLELDAPAV